MFGERDSGMHTSIDTIDIQIMKETNAYGLTSDKKKGYRETFQLQDLIMLTDMYSVP